jgi:hypothetical protein
MTIWAAGGISRVNVAGAQLGLERAKGWRMGILRDEWATQVSAAVDWR